MLGSLEALPVEGAAMATDAKPPEVDPFHTFLVKEMEDSKTKTLHVYGTAEKKALFSLAEISSLLGGSHSASQLLRLVPKDGKEGVVKATLKTAARGRQVCTLVPPTVVEQILRLSRLKSIEVVRRWWQIHVRPFLGTETKDGSDGTAAVPQAEVTDTVVRPPTDPGKGVPLLDDGDVISHDGVSPAVCTTYGCPLAEFSRSGDYTLRVYGTFERPLFLLSPHSFIG